MQQLGPIAQQNFIISSGIIFLLIVVFIIFWIDALVDIKHHEFQGKKSKLFWFLFVLLIAPLGVPLYIVIGKKQRMKKT